MSAQQIVILADDEAEGESMPALGTRQELFESLGRCNTAPASKLDEDVLHGPGFRLELSPHQDPVTQMLMTIDDEDIAWTVIMSLAKRFRWKMLDPMTGRELKPR